MTDPRPLRLLSDVSEGNSTPASPALPVVWDGEQASLLPSESARVAKADVQRRTLHEKKEVAVMAATYVFEYWREQYGKPRAKLDANRLRVVLRAVADCDGHLSDLLYALDGARKDDWIMGRARGSAAKYDTPETILRDRASVERHADRMSGWGRNESHPAILAIPEDLRLRAGWS